MSKNAFARIVQTGSNIRACSFLLPDAYCFATAKILYCASDVKSFLQLLLVMFEENLIIVSQLRLCKG